MGGMFTYLLITSFFMILSFTFHALAPACNLLSYFVKFLLLFRFHLYNFASLIDLLTAKGCRHILIFNHP